MNELVLTNVQALMNLIQSAKINPEAFGLLYEKYSDQLLKFIYYRVSTFAEAEDLFGQTWEIIFKKIQYLETDKELGFQKWMFTVARNLITDKYRSAKEPSIELDENWSDEEPHPQRIHELKEEHLFLHEMMEHLSPLQREILGLHFFSDLKIKEIAEILDMEENTVSQYLSRSLKRLRTWMGK